MIPFTVSSLIRVEGRRLDLRFLADACAKPVASSVVRSTELVFLLIGYYCFLLLGISGMLPVPEVIFFCCAPRLAPAAWLFLNLPPVPFNSGSI